MKVLILSHFPLEGSGSSVYTRDLASFLVKNGHEVRVVCTGHDNVTGFNFPVSVIKFKKEFRDEAIADLSSNEKENDSVEYDLGFDFPAFTVHAYSKNTFSSLVDYEIDDYIDVYKSKVDQIIKDFSPDIIHTQHIWLASYVASTTGIPYVITSHGAEFASFDQDSRYHPYLKEAVSSASKIIAISSDLKKKILSKFNVHEAKIEIVPKAFDSEVFYINKNISKKEVLKKYNIDYNNEKIVFCANKLTKSKGIDLLLSASALYNKKFDDVITLIAGSGDIYYYDELIRLKEELSLNNLYFLSYRDHSKIAELNNIADVFVSPARIEPFGLSALEALACGTPVITSSEGGFPDFVNKEVGLMCSVENYSSVSSSVIKIVNSSFKERNKEHISHYASSFSWNKIVSKIIEIYNLIV
ncbi:glycosyltransferase family 4 protein [Patescibacteria group bacterium]|nr:glycosyltransferase family 4 protein [Patescibacteria group bacterium]